MDVDSYFPYIQVSYTRKNDEKLFHINEFRLTSNTSFHFILNIGGYGTYMNVDSDDIDNFALLVHFSLPKGIYIDVYELQLWQDFLAFSRVNVHFMKDHAVSEVLRSSAIDTHQLDQYLIELENTKPSCHRKVEQSHIRCSASDNQHRTDEQCVGSTDPLSSSFNVSSSSSRAANCHFNLSLSIPLHHQYHTALDNVSYAFSDLEFPSLYLAPMAPLSSSSSPSSNKQQPSSPSNKKTSGNSNNVYLYYQETYLGNNGNYGSYQQKSVQPYSPLSLIFGEDGLQPRSLSVSIPVGQKQDKYQVMIITNLILFIGTITLAYFIIK